MISYSDIWIPKNILILEDAVYIFAVDWSTTVSALVAVLSHIGVNFPDYLTMPVLVRLLESCVTGYNVLKAAMVHLHGLVQLAHAMLVASRNGSTDCGIFIVGLS